jgi:transcriptional regulator with XRE-family HTH domain
VSTTFPTDYSFGPRLRRERERRRITIASIAANTKISASLLEGLERDDVSRWPSGIFRRSFIRAYAAAIGLDPEATTREFLSRFPDPFSPPAAAPVGQGATSARPPAETALRLTMAEQHTFFLGGKLLRTPWPRLVATVWDLGVVGAIGLSLFVALNTFWMPLGIAMLCYYAGGILVLGNTPGVCLFAPTPKADPPTQPVPSVEPTEVVIPAPPLRQLRAVK